MTKNKKHIAGESEMLKYFRPTFLRVYSSYIAERKAEIQKRIELNVFKFCCTKELNKKQRELDKQNRAIKIK